MEGLGFRIKGLWFGVEGLSGVGFRITGSGFGIKGSGLSF